MLSDITSDQRDFTQCRRCGVTLAARLLSCPSCGANQVDSLDPPGWLPPTSPSAKARLPAPRRSITPQLAAPAAWNTPAGAEDDRFYANYDPWVEPKRARRLPLLMLAAGVLLAFAAAGYLLLRPTAPVVSVAPKAVFGSVTAQKAGQLAALPPVVSAPVVVPPARPVVVPTPAAKVAASDVVKPAASAAKVAGSDVVKPAASAPLVAKQAAPATLDEPTIIVLAPSEPASSAPVAVAHAANPVASSSTGTAEQSAPARAVPTQIASVPKPAASAPAAKPSTPSTPSAVSRPAATPKQVKTLAVTTRHAAPPAMEAKDAKRAAAPSQDQIQARADAARNLQIAQAMMQKGNLSGAQSRLAAVLSTQPKNHDALSLRADLNTREQQRDASLDVARACAYMSHWTCAWHNAGNAMVIDSSNAEARSLVAQAMHESQVENTPPAPPTPAIEAPHEPPPHH